MPLLLYFTINKSYYWWRFVTINSFCLVFIPPHASFAFISQASLHLHRASWNPFLSFQHEFPPWQIKQFSIHIKFHGVIQFWCHTFLPCLCSHNSIMITVKIIIKARLPFICSIVKRNTPLLVRVSVKCTLWIIFMSFTQVCILFFIWYIVHIFLSSREEIWYKVVFLGSSSLKKHM